jgi:hypothetical protein
MTQTERKEENVTEEGKKKISPMNYKTTKKRRCWPDDVLRPADCSDVVRSTDGASYIRPGDCC